MIRCKPNGKVYVGQSTNIEKRWNNHKWNLGGNYHHCKKLQEDWNIYGEDNFEFKVIQKCKEDNLDELEIIHIEQFMAFEKGYNETKGGKGVKGLSGEKHHYYGKHLDDEHKNNISESLKGKPKTEEHKEHIRLTMIENGTTKGENNPNYGKHLSDETKRKLSEANKGVNNFMYGKTGKNSPNYGKTGENNPKSKPVIQIDPNTNEIVNTYPGVREAERQTGFDQGAISRCCRGEQKIHKGYKWMFLEDYEKII